MNIGTRLRDLIDAENMTQRQLADALHISPSALNGYINQGKEPDYNTLALLASYFHTSTDYLLGLNNIRTYSFNSLSKSEGEVLGLYRSLSANIQKLIYAELKAVYQVSERA